jgi:hypothetical protein
MFRFVQGRQESKSELLCIEILSSFQVRQVWTYPNAGGVVQGQHEFVFWIDDEHASLKKIVSQH